MKKLAFIALSCIALSGCFKEKAPEISDPESIVIEGTKYTAAAYLEKFCFFEGSEYDENCRLARQQMKKDQGKIRNIDW